jgi:hypothetical protein
LIDGNEAKEAFTQNIYIYAAEFLEQARTIFESHGNNKGEIININGTTLNH